MENIHRFGKRLPLLSRIQFHDGKRTFRTKKETVFYCPMRQFIVTQNHKKEKRKYRICSYLCVVWMRYMFIVFFYDSVHPLQLRPNEILCFVTKTMLYANSSTTEYVIIYVYALYCLYGSLVVLLFCCCFHFGIR